MAAALPMISGESGLSRYLAEIRRFPMLEPEQEYMLAKRWREHADTEAAHKLCRTAALGGHVARCDGCGLVEIAYNSCRNRHCPKCQGATARAWLEKRQADLLPVAYYHVVFTLPGAIAFQNKAAVYDLLMKTSAETQTTIAADPKRFGVQIGFKSVLHTWGSALTHHPHVHIIVPGGGLSPDGERCAKPAG